MAGMDVSWLRQEAEEITLVDGVMRLDGLYCMMALYESIVR